MKYLALSLFALITISLSAQVKFHRNYPLAQDSATQVKGGLVLNDLSNLMVSGLVDKDSTMLTSLIFTSLKPKGDLNWTKKIIVDSTSKVNFTNATFSGFQGKDNTIYYAVSLSNANRANKIIGSIRNDGTLGWARVVYSDSTRQVSNLGTHQLAYFRDTFFYELADLGSNNITHLNLWKTRGTLERSHAITAKTGVIAPKDVELGLKKQLGLMGTTGFNSGYFLGILDTLGTVRSGRQYRDTSNLITQFFPQDINPAKDSGYVVAGRYVIVNRTNPANSYVGSFVSKHDSLGRLQWSRFINVADSFAVAITNAVSTNANTITIAGNYTDPKTFKAIPFMAALDANGNQKWAKRYIRVNSSINQLGTLSPTKDGDYGFFTSVLKPNSNDYISSILRTDAEGTTTCEDTIKNNIFYKINLRQDTLELVSTLTTKVKADTFKLKTTEFTGFTIPTLPLAVRPFCPNEPILWTLRATTPKAISYKWSTGSTSDTIVVKETGEFSVEVKVDSNVCFILCDTVNIGRLSKPKVEIDVQTGNFCTNGLLTLTSRYTPGSTLVSTVWSTGQTNVNRIETGAGRVTVTVTDACMEVKDTFVNVVLPRLISTVNITSNFGNYCAVLTGQLTAVADAAVNRYIWSTGASSSLINIANPGTYSVTVTDFCNNPKTANIIIAPGNIPKRVTALDVSIDPSTVCSDNMLGLKSIITGQFNSILWSNSQTTPDIKVPNAAGSYTLRVIDDCGTKTKEVSTVFIDPVCFKIPSIFFPESNLISDTLTNNKLFMVFSRDCNVANIQDFEFRVFNRFGQEVFSTNTISQGWDGRFNDNPVPPDAYVYFVRYKQGDCSLDTKGSVTLIR
jgi:gliding motility-associated-like protein